jgi:hypothetical protein
MTTDALDRIGQQNGSAAATAERIGQATAVEQARAVAEVQAAIVVAQQCPRDEQRARQQMQDSCRMMALAERASFRYSRGGSTVTGPSIHLARELARCWGNIQYGIAELRRDDTHGQSEMQAFAWDVQTNSRSSNTFIVPHKRDKTGGPVALTDMRDIYENNANNGARRVREAIFAVLPPWFTEEAKTLCGDTLRDGGGVPLPQRIGKAVDAFAGLGIKPAELETRIGRPRARWDEHDVAQLLVIFTSLQRGEVTRDEEFPAPRVTAEEIAGPKARKTKAVPEPPTDVAGEQDPLAGIDVPLAQPEDPT